ncbi:hypothetical protein [Nocardiopsis sp. CC223A]|uniref:hypothetical protein n=1 Tax=Nocardiopsis sp. CC223A TaxID=3044051 RepID=UPI00278BE5B0|nr:hypothetical protein [Nocardiopsis sp. CC223A]
MTTQNGTRTAMTPGPQAPAPGAETDESRYLRGLPAPSVLDRGRRRLALASLRRPAAASAGLARG